MLFDQGTTAPLRGRFPAHSAVTLTEKGWSEKGDGEWVDAAEREGYDVRVTTDQRLPCQQNPVGGGSHCRSRYHSPWNSLGGSDEAEPR